MKNFAFKLIGKLKVSVILVAVMCMVSSKASAGDFSFGLTSEGANAWTSIPQMPVALINTLLGSGASGYSINWLSVSDDQGSIPLKQGNFFGLKARDMFRYFGYGITFGYQPRFSMVGIFVNAGYNFRQFRMQPDRALSDLEKYKAHSFTAGISVRFTPLVARVNDSFNEYYERWSPIIEVGTKYNKVFSCRAPYGNAKDQFGSGFSTRFGAGVRFSNWSATLSYEMPTYNYFNKDFVAPDGSKPYANIKSKSHNINVTILMDF